MNTEIVWVTIGRSPAAYHDAQDCDRGHPAQKRIPTIGEYARAAGLRRCLGCIARAARHEEIVDERRIRHSTPTQIRGAS